MTILWTVLNVIRIVFLVFILLASARILLTWFPGFGIGPANAFLQSVTEPYFRPFRKMEFLRKGPMDFTTLVAVLVLVIVFNILSMLVDYGAEAITAGVVGAIVLQGLWSGFASVLFFFLVVVALRFLTILFRRETGVLDRTLDVIATPFARFTIRVISLFKKSGSLRYPVVLILTALWLSLLRFGGGFLVNRLVLFLAGL